MASGWVSLINLFGKMAKTNSNERTTIGLSDIDIESDTMAGATMIPNKLMASMIPAAVDWICTEKDSV